MTPSASGQLLTATILTLDDVVAALTSAGYVTQHEADKGDNTVLFLLNQQPVVVTAGKNFVRVGAPLLELDANRVPDAKMPELCAELLAGQITVAPFAYAIVPGDGKPGTLMLISTLVLTELTAAELIETIHRLPGALVTAQEILEQYAV